MRAGVQRGQHLYAISRHIWGRHIAFFICGPDTRTRAHTHTGLHQVPLTCLAYRTGTQAEVEAGTGPETGQHRLKIRPDCLAATLLIFYISFTLSLFLFVLLQDERSPTSSGNESDDSSDVEIPMPTADVDAAAAATPQELKTEATAAATTTGTCPKPKQMSATLSYQTETGPSTSTAAAAAAGAGTAAAAGATATDNKYIYPATSFANIPPDMLRQLIQSGQLQLHAEEGE